MQYVIAKVETAVRAVFAISYPLVCSMTRQIYLAFLRRNKLCAPEKLDFHIFWMLNSRFAVKI